MVCAETEQFFQRLFFLSVFFKDLKIINLYEGNGGSYREEYDLFFIIGKNEEFGESYYIRSFEIQSQVSVESVIYMLTSWVV